MVRRQKSEHNTQEARQSIGDRLLAPPGQTGELRGSKSDTNLAAAEPSFVVVTEADLVPPAERRRLLRDGGYGEGRGGPGPAGRERERERDTVY